MTNSMDKVEDIVGQLRHGLTPDWFGENLEIRNRALGRKAADLIQSQQALIEEMRKAVKELDSEPVSIHASYDGGGNYVYEDCIRLDSDAVRRLKALSQKDQIDG